ncbi:MAG: hypothetical protein B7Z55_11250 [Planctomycetales bacterium 12-60-4]|nr:MAG: hypothetical protein B7Z55_11250 [Planctomycetales bacterium 12-60-4]
MERFPWLLKFLDCHEYVSVQVHPNDDLARRLCPTELGKSEAWVIVAADPGSRIYAGLLPGVGPADVEAHVRAGTLVECLHSFEPQIGDCVSLPAGTVHSLGGGILVAEVQQTSDATFRLFDWNRPGLDGKPRPLHLHEALEAIDWELGPVSPLTPAPLPQPATCVTQSELLIENEFFRWERYVARAGDWQISNDRLAVWTVIHGRATLTHGDSPSALRLGESLLIPPSTIPARWSFDGPTKLLKVTAPLAERPG